MNQISTVVQIIIAAGIVNVWLLRFGKSTPYRPEGANSLKEEFAKYGLPDAVRVAVGGAKLTLAALLVAGIWYPQVAAWAGAGMAVLMLGAIGFHVRVGDPPVKSLPALLMFVMSAFVAWANGLFQV
jgi:hypothetical protein